MSEGRKLLASGIGLGLLAAAFLLLSFFWGMRSRPGPASSAGAGRLPRPEDLGVVLTPDSAPPGTPIPAPQPAKPASSAGSSPDPGQDDEIAELKQRGILAY